MGKAKRSSVSNLASIALDQTGARKLPMYEAALNSALLANELPYGKKWFGDEFRNRAHSADWVASLLASDAYMEGYSATRLSQYAATITDPVLSVKMFRHAKDEAKHSRIFTRVLFETFPSLRSEGLEAELARYSPDLQPIIRDADLKLETPQFEEVLNSLILINLYEVKAIVLGKLLAPNVVAHAPDDNRQQVGEMLNAVIADEGYHVRYSADFIENACQLGYREYVDSAMSEFQATLNSVTQSELERDLKFEQQCERD